MSALCAVVRPGSLQGRVSVPPGKSAAHRLLLCAALARGESMVSNVSGSEDINATLRAVKALGAEIRSENSTVCINVSEYNKTVELDCGESGSTLRFLVPVCAALGIDASFTGQGRLPQRPIGAYLELLPEHGVHCETAGGLPLSIHGRLTPGRFSISGGVSSQFVTGLLLALPLLDGESEIVLTSPLESAAYVDMTLRAMQLFGVKAMHFPPADGQFGGWRVSGVQSYAPCTCTVEGDWSQAAFFLCAGALGGNLAVKGLDFSSAQGDKSCAALFAAFGADIQRQGDDLHARAGDLHGIELDASQVPDLVPALAAAAALAHGETRIYGASRLRIKESDRLKAMAEAINSLGGSAKELPDGLLITGVETLSGGTVNGCNDHRIVMAAAMLATRASGPVTITDAGSVNKSYPDFWRDFRALGGNADVLDMG